MQCVLRKMDHSGWREVSSRVRELQLRHVREAALGVLAWGKTSHGEAWVGSCEHPGSKGRGRTQRKGLFDPDYLVLKAYGWLSLSQCLSEHYLHGDKTPTD